MKALTLQTFDQSCGKFTSELAEVPIINVAERRPISGAPVVL